MMKYETKYDVPNKQLDIKLELDVFGKKSHKITLSGSVKGTKLENGIKLNSEAQLVSKGFDMDIKAAEEVTMQTKNLGYDLKVHYKLDKLEHESHASAKLNMKEAELVLKMFNYDLINVNSKLQLSKDNQVADTTISVHGLKPLVTHFEVKDLNTMMFTLSKKDTPKNKLQISSGLVFGQIADFRAEIMKGSTKNDLIHASVKLDDANFMKPDFGVSVENIQKMLLVSPFFFKFPV